MDEADPAKWKANLRCALNKSRDFQLFYDGPRDMPPQPYKIYEVCSNGPAPTGTRPGPVATWKAVTSGCRKTQGPSSQRLQGVPAGAVLDHNPRTPGSRCFFLTSAPALALGFGEGLCLLLLDASSLTHPYVGSFMGDMEPQEFGQPLAAQMEPQPALAVLSLTSCLALSPSAHRVPAH